MEQVEEEIAIDEVIGESFHDAFWAVMEEAYTYYNFVGGRGSLKSSFISIVLVLLIMQYPDMHAVCYRKVAGTLATSVYDQIT